MPSGAHHAFCTDDTLVIEQAEPRHRQHAIIEQVFFDLGGGPLAHLPSGRFNANAAWLTFAAAVFNLMRTGGRIAGAFHAKATGATLRRTLINVLARIATSARRIHLHLPEDWPWAWEFERVMARTGHRLACCQHETPRQPTNQDSRTPATAGQPTLRPARKPPERAAPTLGHSRDMLTQPSWRSRLQIRP